jgi:hypothetical protein
MEELKAIQVWLRGKVPVEAVMPSETLIYNHIGEVACFDKFNHSSLGIYCCQYSRSSNPIHLKILCLSTASYTKKKTLMTFANRENSQETIALVLY